MAKYRNVEFTVSKGSGYSQYIIEATYKGVEITVTTNNSQMWDFLEDDSNPKKRQEALRYCHGRIMREYDSYQRD